MKVLMITRKVDKSDWLAGFAYSWVDNLAKNIAELRVISMEEGEDEGLPANTSVYFVGKKNLKKWQRLVKLGRLLKEHKKNVDLVFVHMHPLYAILAFFTGAAKPIVLWYTHKNVDLKLRMATFLVDRVVSASPESFRLPTKKVSFLGHGIPVEKFFSLRRYNGEQVKIISVSRISPAKRLDLFIDALGELKRAHPELNFRASIAGGPGLKSHTHLEEELKQQVQRLQLEREVQFIGPVPYDEVDKLYARHDIFVNLSETGSIDKAVLEAAASGCLIITSNEAFIEILPEFIVLPKAENVAEKIFDLAILTHSEKEKKAEALKNWVKKNYSLKNFMEKLVKVFTDVVHE